MIAAKDGGFAVVGIKNNNVWLAKFAPDSGVNPPPEIPDFPSLIILPLCVITAVLVTMVYLKKRRR